MTCQSKKQAQDYKTLKHKHQDSQHTAEILLSFILGYMFRLICEPLSGLIYKHKLLLKKIYITKYILHMHGL